MAWKRSGKRSDWSAEAAVKLAKRVSRLKRAERLGAFKRLGAAAEVVEAARDVARAGDQPALLRPLSLAELAWLNIRRPPRMALAADVVIWPVEPVERDTFGIAQRIIGGLCNVHAFRNYDFLKRRDQLFAPDGSVGELPEPEAWRSFRISLMREFGRRRWPVYVAETYDDWLRLEYFEVPRMAMAPQYGGAVRDLTAEEWSVVAGIAGEVAGCVEVGLEWSADEPAWFGLARDAPELSAKRVRELREDVMQRFTERFGMRWPEAWRDRVVEPWSLDELLAGKRAGSEASADQEGTREG